VHSWNARSPITVTLSGMVTLVMACHLKPSFAIRVTGRPLCSAGITTAPVGWPRTSYAVPPLIDVKAKPGILTVSTATLDGTDVAPPLALTTQ
jgi:hypothetical protein